MYTRVICCFFKVYILSSSAFSIHFICYRFWFLLPLLFTFHLSNMPEPRQSSLCYSVNQCLSWCRVLRTVSFLILSQLDTRNSLLTQVISAVRFFFRFLFLDCEHCEPYNCDQRQNKTRMRWANLSGCCCAVSDCDRFTTLITSCLADNQ